MEDLLMPYDSESEAGVLGYLTTLEDTEDDVFDLLFDNCFYCADTTEVWHCIKELKQKEQEVNIFTVSNLLQGKGGVEGGIPPFLLRNNVVSKDTAIWAIERLHRKAQERAIIEAGYKLIQIGQYNTKHIEKQKEGDELEREVAALMGKLTYQTALEDYTTSEDLFQTAYNEIPVELQLLPGITTGFEDLDWLLGGWQEKNLIYIAGRPGMGKTAFVLNSILQTSKKSNFQGKFLFYSMEQSLKQLAYRCFAISSKDISTLDIRRGNLDQQQREELARLILRLKKLPVIWKEPKDNSFKSFERTVNTIVRKEKLAGIVIDHMGQFTYPAANETEKAVKVAYGLQQMCRVLGCPIIALSQLNRDCEKGVNKKPNMSHLKQSSALEETGWIVLLLYRDEYYNPDSEQQGILTVIIAKNKEGACGEVNLSFNKNTLAVLNLEKDSYNGTPF